MLSLRFLFVMLERLQRVTQVASEVLLMADKG